ESHPAERGGAGVLSEVLSMRARILRAPIVVLLRWFVPGTHRRAVPAVAIGRAQQDGIDRGHLVVAPSVRAGVLLRGLQDRSGAGAELAPGELRRSLDR